MKRYFGKIDETNNNTFWELNKKTNDILIIFPYLKYYSSMCISMTGNLYAVLEEIEGNIFKVLFLSESPEGMSKYFNFNEFTSEDAYYWALYIGNKDVMIDRITESNYAFCWAYHIGNTDVMIDRIADSEYAYLWALYIGNKDVMIDRITESNYAFCWAYHIGNTDVMIDRIADSEYAYLWAREIGDKDVMKERITDKGWMEKFEQLP